MKKLVALVLSVVMVLGMITVANAASVLEDATKYTLGTNARGTITEEDTSDVYGFELLNSGKIDINFSAGIKGVELKFYDENGKQMWNKYLNWNDTVEEISYQVSHVLCKGKYYFSVSRYQGEGEYNFEITETSIYETFVEPQGGSNNSTKASSAIVDNVEYIGCIAENDDSDVYKFELATSGMLNINFKGAIRGVELKLYDVNGKQMWNKYLNWNDTIEEISYQVDLNLCQGQYYFSVSRYQGEGEYNFKFLFTSANESFAEEQQGSNNKVNSASFVDINRKYNGFLAINDDVDIYRISINDPKVVLNFSAKMRGAELEIFNEKGERKWNKYLNWNDTIEEINYEEELELDNGLYYLSVSEYNGEGTFSFYFTNGGQVTEAVAPNSVIKVIVNGSKVAFDQPPVLESGRTLVPLRAIFEALGAEVNWDEKTQTVEATKASKVISLQIGSTSLYVDGVVVVLDVPAKLINSRTLVPVRAISEAFGCKVDWNGDTQTVTVTQ